jgi:hypothetical protein
LPSLALRASKEDLQSTIDNLQFESQVPLAQALSRGQALLPPFGISRPAQKL